MHTSVFIVSLSKWSLTFKIGVPPRIDLILLVLICRVTPIIIKLWVLIHKVHPTSHTYVWIYVVHPKNYKNKNTTIQCTKLYSPRFGLSTFCMSTFLVGRCFGISTFWFGLVCRYFGMSVFRFVDVLVVDDSVCRRFDQLPTKGSTLTHQILFINIVIILQTTYQNGFLQWHFS